MMPRPRPPCSDTTTGWYPVLALEGMPGAGKTSAATALAAQNWTVIGEYTTVTGDVVPIHAHPDVGDDAGRQRNWLRKHHQVHAARRNGPVFCDRDWLSALAYAYSVADTDHGELLDSRARWASDCLDHGDLTLASTYIVFQVDPTISLQRRANRLTPLHPWSGLHGLIRLAAFYAGRHWWWLCTTGSTAAAPEPATPTTHSSRSSWTCSPPRCGWSCSPSTSTPPARNTIHSGTPRSLRCSPAPALQGLR